MSEQLQSKLDEAAEIIRNVLLRITRGNCNIPLAVPQ